MRTAFIVAFIMVAIGFFIRHGPDEAAVRSAVMAVVFLIVYGVAVAVRAGFRKIVSRN